MQLDSDSHIKNAMLLYGAGARRRWRMRGAPAPAPVARTCASSAAQRSLRATPPARCATLCANAFDQESRVPLCVRRSAQLTARAPTPPAGGTDSDCRTRVLGHSSRCGGSAGMPGRFARHTSVPKNWNPPGCCDVQVWCARRCRARDAKAPPSCCARSKTMCFWLRGTPSRCVSSGITTEYVGLPGFRLQYCAVTPPCVCMPCLGELPFLCSFFVPLRGCFCTPSTHHKPE